MQDVEIGERAHANAKPISTPRCAGMCPMQAACSNEVSSCEEQCLDRRRSASLDGTQVAEAATGDLQPITTSCKVAVIEFCRA